MTSLRLYKFNLELINCARVTSTLCRFDGISVRSSFSALARLSYGKVWIADVLVQITPCFKDSYRYTIARYNVRSYEKQENLQLVYINVVNVATQRR